MKPEEYKFDDAVAEWSRVPWDDFGYFGYLDSREVIRMAQPQFAQLLDYTMAIRWDVNQWRNKDNKLKEFMQLGRWTGKRVLDFGCGFGGDSIQFASVGAQVMPADLSPATLPP